jgi:MinD-like ATPase involved in chromosome partitioning or flagellar assembly
MTKIVLTNSFRGGTGKSTIISNIGSYLATLGMKVVIIDGDIISPGIHAIFGLSEESFTKTLTDFLLGKGDIADAVYDISDNLGLSQNSIMLVPSSIASGEIVTLLQQTGNADKMANGLKRIKEKFEPDFILIDTHPGLNDPFLVATGFSDIILNIVRPDNQDYQGAQVSAEISRKMNIKMYLILNKVHKKIGKSKLIKNVEDAFNLPVAGVLPFSDDVLFSESQFVFSEKYPNHKFSAEIHNIVTKVFNIKPKEHLEVMHDLLQYIKDGKKCSIDNISGAKDLPCKNSGEYLDTFIEDGFIREIKGNLKITKKGSKFLKKYQIIKRFADDFRL